MKTSQSELSSSAIDKANEVFLQNYGSRNLRLVRGEGIYVWDSEGNKYLDCIMGIAVNALGHCHKRVTAAIAKQAAELCHVSNLFLVESQIKLATWLSDTTGYPKVFFCNSGTEANEALIKFVRKYRVKTGETHKTEIISFSSSFHGRTLGALSLTGQPKLKQGFEPLLNGFVEVPFNDVEAFKKACSQITSAVFLEPIQAEGGVMSPSPQMLKAIAECQKQGVLVIADEIQTGCGRTGHFLASESWDFKPDAVSLAKSLGGGLPLGAVLLSKKIAESVAAGDHGTTFGGNPVACAAGLAVAEEIGGDGFLPKVRENAALLRDGLEKAIAEIQSDLWETALLGKGFLIGIRYKGDLAAFISRCKSEGLLVCKAGTDVLRLLPPLNITREQIFSVVEIFKKSMVQ